MLAATSCSSSTQLAEQASVPIIQPVTPVSATIASSATTIARARRVVPEIAPLRPLSMSRT